jgi:hypothetical protein
LVKMISRPALRSSSPFRYSSPLTAYCARRKFSLRRSGCSTCRTRPISISINVLIWILHQLKAAAKGWEKGSLQEPEACRDNRSIIYASLLRCIFPRKGKESMGKQSQPMSFAYMLQVRRWVHRRLRTEHTTKTKDYQPFHPLHAMGLRRRLQQVGMQMYGGFLLRKLYTNPPADGGQRSHHFL